MYIFTVSVVPTDVREPLASFTLIKRIALPVLSTLHRIQKPYVGDVTDIILLPGLPAIPQYVVNSTVVVCNFINDLNCSASSGAFEKKKKKLDSIRVS